MFAAGNETKKETFRDTQRLIGEPREGHVDHLYLSGLGYSVTPVSTLLHHATSCLCRSFTSDTA
jgi:hypothetical protein